MKLGTPMRQQRLLLLAGLAALVVIRLFPILVMDVQPTSDMGWSYQRAIDLINPKNVRHRGNLR